MIIDIPYIKQILNTQIKDEKIAYLINHYFDYICEHINVDTTLEEEQISLEPLENPIDNPRFPNDELTLFQETLILAIACNMSTVGISPDYISQELCNHYISFFDTVEQNDDGLYLLTYCDVFKSCLEQLTNILNADTNVGYLRRLLNIPIEEVSNNELEFLIDHYTKYLSDIIPNVDTSSALFQQAVYLSVACHIFKTNPVAITTPVMYYVDEVREKFEIDFDKYGNTWCDLANAAINDLKKKAYGYYGLRAYDRPGARTKYNAYGPTGGAR